MGKCHDEGLPSEQSPQQPPHHHHPNHHARRSTSVPTTGLTLQIIGVTLVVLAFYAITTSVRVHDVAQERSWLPALRFIEHDDDSWGSTTGGSGRKRSIGAQDDQELVFYGTNGFPTVVHKIDQATCDRVSWQYQLEQGPLKVFTSRHTNYSKELDLSWVDCDLAVLATGFERSGSTLQHKILTDVANFVGGQVLSTYWQRHIHMASYNLKAGRQFDTEKREFMYYKDLYNKGLGSFEMFNNQSDEGDQKKKRIIVIKSHEFDSPIVNMCRRQLVFTTTRQLDKAATSWLKLSWARDLSEMVTMMDSSMLHRACWRRAGATEWQYEVFSSNPLDWGTKALWGIGLALGKDDKEIYDISMQADYVKKLQEWLFTDSHKFSTVLKATSSGDAPTVNVTLPDEWREVIRVRYKGLGMIG